ncbi:MAG: M23 family metallopeptidase [Thermodesulfobacteriota bacterium]|nr:M23 family metallopeptidase [Thermodesulfobacteriota bacterium]
MAGFSFYRTNRFRWQSSEVRGKKKKWLLLSGSFLVALSLIAYFFVLPYQPIPSRGGPTEPVSPPAGEIPTPEPRYQIIEGEIKEKSTFSKSLAEKDISQPWIELIVAKLKPLLNFKKMKGGKFHFICDEREELVRFIYEGSPTEIYEIEKGPQGYTARRKDVPLETYLVKVGGEIRSSLFEAVDAIGEKDQLVISFSEILASEVDFYKDVRRGDRFQVVVEKVYKEKEFIRYGPIHAVEYQRGEKVIRGVHFRGDFYNEKGVSLRKAFLKVPLRFTRISSRFSKARKHPILGGVFPHYGVDYAAPSGTPVWAVADGTVVSCGWGGGFGKQVVIRHPNGYMTYYGHLSGYGPGIRKGVRVNQKQVIGYVGSTGLSTGPHLDYRMVKDGRFRNPLKESFPAGLPIEKGKIDAFEKRRDEMVVWLQGAMSDRKRLESPKREGEGAGDGSEKEDPHR